MGKKAENPKVQIFSVRCTLREAGAIAAEAAKRGLTVSALLRERVFGESDYA